MPEWAQFVVGLAALFGATTLLWTKAVKPLIKIAADYDKLEARVEALERKMQDRDG